jgi:hypothetical protein
MDPANFERSAFDLSAFFITNSHPLFAVLFSSLDFYALEGDRWLHEVLSLQFQVRAKLSGA